MAQDAVEMLLRKIDLKFKILMLELARQIYYSLVKEEEVDEKMKKRISRLITNMRDQLTEISKVERGDTQEEKKE